MTAGVPLFKNLTLMFLLTRPSRDVTVFVLLYQQLPYVSTHTSLAGRDLYHISNFLYKTFLLTRPSRDVTHFFRIVCV